MMNISSITSTVISRVPRSRPLLQMRFWSTTPVQCLNQKWRKERGLPLNPNATNVLANTQDYSFLDGRPTPYGVRQKNRILKHRALTEQIIKLSAEVDFAVNRHKQIEEDERNRRQQILDSKLKPKGVNLLKKK